MRLVIFERDWADEFSPFGFAVMNDEEFEEFRAYYSVPREWYFGSNEGFTDDDENLFAACVVKEITREEANTLILLFNIKDYDWCYRSVGIFPGKPEDEDDVID